MPPKPDRSPYSFGLAVARDAMIETQLRRRGIDDEALLDAMRQVPREAFVPEGAEEWAYADTPLQIDEGQTISQPYMVAAMIEAAAISRHDRVLEVGAGSGYAAAVISRVAERVYAIERHASLAETAARRIEKLGYSNVEIRHGDGSKGWPECAPFNAILVAASAIDVPSALREQLTIGGRLIIPIERGVRFQVLRRIVRKTATDFDIDDLGSVKFVPLITGEDGE
jgi:protein-L-isoaspartate(D-aspartate) O-methyltransferase